MIELEDLEPDDLAWLFRNHPEIFKTFVLNEWTSEYDLCRGERRWHNVRESMCL